jgi:hypothetical protein
LVKKLQLVHTASPAVPTPPQPLGKHGAALWRAINLEFAITDIGGIQMAALACSALDRAEQCSQQITADGEVIRGKSGLREHPLLKIELANRAFTVRTLQKLGLDSEPLKTIGRPPSRSWSG